MAEFSVVTKLFLALVLGAAIGLERESYEDSISEDGTGQRGALGVRSFSLVTLLGAIAGLLYHDLLVVSVIISITFMVLVLAYYVTGSFLLKDNGFTTELAVMFSYLLGLFLGLEVFAIQLIVAIAVVLILILSRKQNIKHFVTSLERTEINGFVSYAIIALVILPFLPNVGYALSDFPGLTNILQSYGFPIERIVSVPLINPYNIWLVVAVVTGVDVLGHVLKRFIGESRGWGVASLIGGFISSTATTISLAQQSRQVRSYELLVASAILSSLASFFQLFVLVSIFNPDLLIISTRFMIAIIASSLTISLFFLYQARNHKEKHVATEWHNGAIFSLAPAIKFASIFLVISLIVRFSLALFGSRGLLASSALASLTGLDAVIINVSELAGSVVSLETALLTLIIVNAVNLMAKVVYSFIVGEWGFAVRFGVSVLIIIAASTLGLL